MHIQEFAENSVDFMHFDPLHGKMQVPWTAVPVPCITIQSVCSIGFYSLFAFSLFLSSTSHHYHSPHFHFHFHFPSHFSPTPIPSPIPDTRPHGRRTRSPSVATSATSTTQPSSSSMASCCRARRQRLSSPSWALPVSSASTLRCVVCVVRFLFVFFFLILFVNPSHFFFLSSNRSPTWEKSSCSRHTFPTMR